MAMAVVVPVIVEVPAVRMNVEMDSWRAIIAISMPAIAFGIANDAGGGGSGTHCGEAQAQERGCCHASKNLLHVWLLQFEPLTR